jgi:outer membrane protein TolC
MEHKKFRIRNLELRIKNSKFKIRNSKFKIALALACWLLSPSVGDAQTALTLRQAVSLATERDTRILEAEAKEQRAGREADVSHARFGPNVFTGTGAVYTYGFPQTPGGAPPSVFSVAYSQTLFDGPAKGRERAADQRIAVQKLTTAQVRVRVITDTALTYLELTGVRQALDRQRHARESAQRVVDLTLERLKEARLLPVDVLQARLSAAQLSQRIAQLEGREMVLEGELRMLTGLPQAESVQIAFEGLPSLPDRSVAELATIAASNSPELKAAELERRAREENVAGERGGYWPSIDLIGNYAVFSKFNNLDTFFTRFQRNNVNVGVEARVPIFRAETAAAVALARSQVTEADVALKRQRDQIELDVRRAAGQAREAAAGLGVAELQLALAQENVRISEARIAEGRADRLDLEKSLVEEGRAWDSFYEAEFGRQKGQLQLRQVTGELNRLFP